MEELWKSAFPRRLKTSGRDNGRYVLIRPIGSGGMANVFLARDEELDIQVAIKIPRTELQTEEDGKRFEREINSMQFRHPNIVRRFNCGVETHGNGSNLFLVMEYVSDSRDLMDLICFRAQQTAGKPVTSSLFPPENIYVVVSQLLDALETIHGHQIVHRDLKPHNILCRRRPNGKLEIKLTDFGIAKWLEDAAAGSTRKLTAEHVVIGTPQYLSPEQALGDKIDPRSDLYAVGAIVYEMVTGRTTTDSTRLMKLGIELTMAFDRSRYPSRLVRDMDPMLEKIILDLLERNPEKRIPSAAEAKRRFTEWAEKRGLLAEKAEAPVTVIPPSEPASGFYRWATMALAVAALGAGVLWFVNREPVLPPPVPAEARVAPTVEKPLPSAPTKPMETAPTSPAVATVPVPSAAPAPPALPDKEERLYHQTVATIKKLRATPGVKCPVEVQATLLDLVVKHPAVPGPYYWVADCLRREQKPDRAALFFSLYKERGGGPTPP